MKNSTKRKWKKGFHVRAAALTFLLTLLLVYGTGVYLFSDFIFLADNRDAATLSAEFLSPTAADLPMLRRQTHTEAYGKTTGETFNTYGYTYLPAESLRDKAAAVAALEERGISYTFAECYSVLPKDRVVYLTYAGAYDGAGYYVNPAVPVTLTLSGHKRNDVPSDNQVGNNLVGTNQVGTNLVYLTFDDGPSAYTEDILDTLGMYGVPATFFTLGKSVQKYPDTARRITEDGHLLASHGNTHDYESIYASAETLLADVRQWQEIVTGIGALPERSDRYFRFPGGSVGNYFGADQRQEMLDGLHDMGYRVYDWNILTNDGVLFLRPDGMDSETYWKETFIETWENCPYDTRIILVHDSIAETEALLPWLLDYVIDAGYTFGTLDMLNDEYYMR